MAHGTPRPDRLRFYPNEHLPALCVSRLPYPHRNLSTSNALLLSRWQARTSLVVPSAPQRYVRAVG